MDHREEQVIGLIAERYHIEHATACIPGIERFNGQPWNGHRDGGICFLIGGELDTFAKEGNGNPGYRGWGVN